MKGEKDMSESGGPRKNNSRKRAGKTGLEALVLPIKQQSIVKVPTYLSVCVGVFFQLDAVYYQLVSIMVTSEAIDCLCSISFLLVTFFWCRKYYILLMRSSTILFPLYDMKTKRVNMRFCCLKKILGKHPLSWISLCYSSIEGGHNGDIQFRFRDML